MIFCTFEFFPNFLKDLVNSFFHKLALVYESFDKKINISDIQFQQEKIKQKRVGFKKISNWFFRPFFLAIAFIIIIFWDIFWHMMLKHLFTFLSSLKLYEKFRFYIQEEANKYFVLFIFILLFIIMEYFGIYSAVLVASGNIVLAVIFYIAKFAMVFPVKVLYKEGHDKLVAIPWFKIRKDLIVSLLIWFESTASFLKAKSIIHQVKYFFKRIKKVMKKDKQYRFIFEFKAYRRLLRMRKKAVIKNAV